MKIISTKDVVTDGVKMLVYGASGAGKTTMLSTIPGVFIISSESGLLSLSEFDIPACEIKTEADLDSAYNFVAKSEYDVIGFDSLSDIAEAILAEQQDKTKDGRQAYGELNKIMARNIRRFRNLKGKHVFFTAKEAKIETNNVLIAQPSMPGASLTINTPYFFDEVLRLEATKKGERILHTVSTFTQVCKDRSNKLDAKEPADLSVIINKITGSK